MDEDKRSARLLRNIADCLGVSVEFFMQQATDPADAPGIGRASTDHDASQALRLLRLYWSLPDQPSKDLALQMMAKFVKETTAG